MINHTPEPWEACGSIVHQGYHGGFDLHNGPNPEADAARIVACVNACAGIETAGLQVPYSELLEHLERCATELAGMIDRHNEQSMEDGSWTYDHQTPWEAIQLVLKAKGEEK